MSTPVEAPPRRRVIVRRKPTTAATAEDRPPLIVRASADPDVAPAPAPGPAEPAPAPAAEDETLADRVLRQSVDGPDDHLLPAPEKRTRDLVKQLDKPVTASGWAKFCSGNAHAIEHGKPKAQRHAERTLVETVTEWRADVAELAPDRMDTLELLVRYGCDHPAPLPPREGAR